MSPRLPSSPGLPSHGERIWRGVLFCLSALMGALALVDFDAGRLAHGLGDGGVACLLLSLEARLPLMRVLMVKAQGRQQSTKELLQEAERHQREHPWPRRIGVCGWALLAASFALRVAGQG